MKLTGSSQKIEDPNEALAKRGSSLTDISVTVVQRKFSSAQFLDFPNGQFSKKIFSRRTVPRMTFSQTGNSPADICPNHMFHFRNTKVTDMN